MAKKSSPYKQQYQKERNRILSTIRRYEKQGGITSIKIPEIPKRITAGSVRRLQKIDLKKIREATDFVDRETGEVKSFQQVQREKRHESRERKKQIIESAKKQAQVYFEAPAPVTITQAELEWEWMLDYAGSLHPKAYWVVIGFFNKQRKLLGLFEAAKMIQQARNDGTFTEIYSFGYDSELITGSLNKLLNYVGATDEQRMEIVNENEEAFAEY